MRLRWIAVGTAVALIVVGILFATRDEGPSPVVTIRWGPFEQHDSAVYLVTERHASAGDTFTDGLAMVLLKRDSRVVIRSVDFVGGDGLELVGALAAGEEREVGFVQIDRHFPPRIKGMGPLVPAEGAEVPRGPGGLEFILGVKILHEGYAWRDGIRVTYEEDGEVGEAVLPFGIVVCPAPRTSDECFDWYHARSVLAPE